MNRAADADLEFKIRILKQSPIFADADDDDLSELARVGKVAAIQRGKPLARKGQEGANVFFVQSGVGAELHAEPGDDRAILIMMHGPGGVAGIVSALLGEKLENEDDDEPAQNPRRIEALSNMSVLSAPAADFFRICRRSENISLALARHLAERHHDLARVYVQSVHHTLEMRLAAFFSRITELSASDDWNPVTNIGKLSQSAIATLLGVSREHVNRTLAMWERSGLIFQNKAGEILVQNARRLAHLTGPHADRSATDKQEDWMWEIDAHLDRGLNQTALHLALEAAKRAPKDLRYQHKAVLATARLGAISEALGLVEKWKLGRDLADEELACLRPRLLRDLAYSQSAADPDRKLLLESAQDYEKVFARSKGFYPGVNAAAGFALAGEKAKAQEVATAVWDVLSANGGDDEEDSHYWRRTTLAECKLLQGDAAAAVNLFHAASNADDATPGKKATTRKQLRRLCPNVGIDEAWIDRVTPQPDIIFFSGPLARGVEEDTDLPSERLLDALDDLVTERDVGWAYGALASGADIVIAEALIEAGVALNVYLPLPPAEFLKSSVHIGGPGWRDRFIKCMRAAESIEWNRRAHTACNAAYRLGAEIAMGKAIRHAAQLETDAVGFFATQKDRDAKCSLSVANAQLWAARGLPMVEIADNWPGGSGVKPAGDPAADALFFALVMQPGAGAHAPKSMVNAADIHISDKKSGVELLLFGSSEAALSQATEFCTSSAADKWCNWLDAGIFPKKILDGAPEDASAQLVTAACKPLTDPGKVFASDPFACVAPLAPGVKASFEYVGYMPTKEKLDPCALYLVQT